MKTISSTYLKTIFEGCAQLGADRSELSKLISERDTELDNPSLRFETKLAPTLLNAAAKELDDPTIGVKIGLMHRPANLLDLGYAFPFCEDLREVMMLNRTYQSLIQQVGATDMYANDGAAYLTWTPNYDDGEIEFYRYFTEMIFAGYTKIGRWLLYGKSNPVLSIQFKHSAPPDLSVHHAAFSDNVSFGASIDRMDVFADVVNVPMPSRNPQMVAHLKGRLDQRLAELAMPGDTANKLMQYIQKNLGEGRPALPDAAKTLGMSERTLRRKLQAEGESYRSVLARARQESCETYLQSGQFSQSEIALMLGFSDHSAYSRAFKTWFGVSPSAYKAALALS